MDLRFARWQVVRFRKARRRQDVALIPCSKNDLWDKVRGLGSETWKGCESKNLSFELSS